MITEEDKERIMSEEIFRDEIRKSLREKEQDSFRKKTWKLINSPIGLWLLSTVFVGSIVYFYNDTKLKNEILANNAATLHKLETETSNRLQQFRLSLSNQNPASIYYENEELAYMIDGTLLINGSLAQKKPVYVFPEYKERTMNSLLYEIERLTIDKKQVSSIKEARIILSKIQTNLMNIEDLPSPDFALSQRISQMAQVQPENLSPEDSKLLAEYQEKFKKFEQGKLSEYHNRIKMNLDSLQFLFQSNPFLKTMSN